MVHLLAAGGRAEVRRRAADVMDVALEVGIVRHLLSLCDKRSAAAHLHDAPLVERERAEGALAEAPTVARERELHFFDSGNPARGIVVGMRGADERQAIDRIELGGRKRGGWRVLHDELVLAIGLDQAFSRHMVAVGVLYGEAFRVGARVGAHGAVSGQKLVVVDMIKRARAEYRAIDESKVTDRKPRIQSIGDFHNGVFPHPIGHKVGVRIEQDRPLQRVRPVIVVGKASQTRLNASDDDGNILEHASDQVRVHHNRVVGTQPALAPRREGIQVAALLGDRIVIHHRVHVPRAHEEPQTRAPEHGDAFRIAPIGLGDHADLVMVRLKKTADNGCTERRVVHIRIAGHVHEVALVPAALAHVLAVHGKEAPAVGARTLRRLLIGASPFPRPLPCPHNVLAIRRALRHERALSPWRGTTTCRARGAIEMR